MAAAAELQQYERAAVLRDKVRAIERTMESQKMAAFARTELDLAGIARARGGAMARRRGQDTGGAGRAGIGAGSDRPAAADRVLRHLEHPGSGIRRIDGGIRGRPAALRGVPTLPDPDGRRGERLRQPSGGASPTLPPHE